MQWLPFLSRVEQQTQFEGFSCSNLSPLVFFNDRFFRFCFERNCRYIYVKWLQEGKVYNQTNLSSHNEDFDLSKAFVSHTVLCEKLERCCIRGVTLDPVSYYLEIRTK